MPYGIMALNMWHDLTYQFPVNDVFLLWKWGVYIQESGAFFSMDIKRKRLFVDFRTTFPHWLWVYEPIHSW